MKQKVLKNVWLRVCMIVAVVTTAFAGTAWAEIHPITVELEGITATSGQIDGNISYSTTGGTISGSSITATTFTLAAANNAKINSVTFHWTVGWSEIACVPSTGATTYFVANINQPEIEYPTVSGLNCEQIVLSPRYGGTGPGFDYISVTYTPAASDYTITAQSSDESKGTVEPDGNVIIAKPNQGYGVDESNPYTITDGEATVTPYNNNAFVVEPTSDCTIVINFVPHTADSKVNFEHELDTYTDWEHGGTIVRSLRSKSDDAHGGKGFYGITNANTAWMKTVNKIEYPGTFTCYVRRTEWQESLTWKIQVSSNGSNWSDVKSYTPSGTTATNWEEFSADLSQHTNVYVRLYYTGSGANGAIDDIDLHMHTVLVDPEIQLAEAFYSSTTAKFTCVSDGVTYYYSFDENTPLDEWTACDGDEVVITQTTTIYMYAARGTNRTNVVSASTVRLDEPITVTVGSAGYATFVAPVAVQFPTDVTAFIVTGATGTAVTMEEVTAVPAGTAVVVKGSADTYELTLATSTDDVTSNLLKASNGAVTGGDGIYALANKGQVGFYPVASTVTIPAGKAYLLITGQVKSFFGFEEEDATSINEELRIKNEEFEGAAIFNLAGQRLQKMQRGINIINGKKILK